MFYDCKSLKNIKELEYLNIKEINNFSYMFNGCSSLLDIKGLENWNVSNGKDFGSILWMLKIIRFKRIRKLERIKWK